MPRYVLLRHDCPPDYRDGPHWDLMLEQAGALRTWSLLELPSDWRQGAATSDNRPVAAEELADHRIAYLDHEGDVSGGRGTVNRLAAGTFDWVEDGETRIVVLANGDLAGRWEWTREATRVWRFVTRRDA